MKSLYASILLLAATGLHAQDDCPNPTGSSELNINNVRASISNSLTHFTQDFNSSYQVPKLGVGEDGPNTIYADGLWISGNTQDNSLKVIASTYLGDEVEVSSGPLQNTGILAADIASCNAYDAVYRAERSDAVLHHEYYTRMVAVADGADPSILSEPPFENGYTTPSYFYTWPAINNNPGYDLYLAPFYDFDEDGLYNPDNGDYPGFDLFGTADCDNLILGEGILLGDQATWYVSNDLREHQSSGGEAMGLEFQVMNYAYMSDDALNDATFVQYTIINRSPDTYTNCVISKWVDFDIGCFQDDYIGTDVQKSMLYGYNGDALDSDCNGQLGYGEQLAAQGVSILAGPLQDSDGIDNPLTNDLQIVEDFNGIAYPGQGIGYDDGIVDNEYMRAGSTLAYDASGGPFGDPQSPLHYYNYMNSTWLDGSFMTHGASGSSGTIPSRYMFPGESDPIGLSTYPAVPPSVWTEGNEANQPGDRRGILSTPTFTMDPGEVNVITYAYIYARDESGNTDAQVMLCDAYDVVYEHYLDCFSEAGIGTGTVDLEMGPAFSLSPNPATEYLTIRLDELRSDITQISVIDLSGRTVMQYSPAQSTIQQLDISSLRAGHYILSLTTSDMLNSRQAFVKY